MQTLMFYLKPCEKPRRFKIYAENTTTGRGGLLSDNLTKSRANAMLNAYQSGALLAGAKVSAQRRYTDPLPTVN